MRIDLKGEKNGGLRTSQKHVTNCPGRRLFWGSCGMNGERLSREKSIINWKHRVRERIKEKINPNLLSQENRWWYYHWRLSLLEKGLNTQIAYNWISLPSLPVSNSMHTFAFLILFLCTPNLAPSDPAMMVSLNMTDTNHLTTLSVLLLIKVTAHCSH